jgi:hypothetical protein
MSPNRRTPHYNLQDRSPTHGFTADSGTNEPLPQTLARDWSGRGPYIAVGFSGTYRGMTLC